MANAAMLILTDSEKGLSGQWMKGIRDRNFRRQTPGIMSPLRTKAAVARLSSTR
jgi:hypothetical protein